VSHWKPGEVVLLKAGIERATAQLILSPVAPMGLRAAGFVMGTVALVLVDVLTKAFPDPRERDMGKAERVK
jgi:hypothetical protein